MIEEKRPRPKVSRRQHKKNLEKKKNRRFLIFMALIVLIALLIFFYTQYKQREVLGALEKENNEAKEEIKRLEEEINILQEDLDRVNTDEFIENYAREKLNMIKEDEMIIVDPEKEE